MRHRKSFNHLGRKAGHRNAMLANMAASLILHKRIKTTTAKAKALKVFVEPLITKSKDDSTHSRRVVFSYLQDKEAVTELFREVSLKIAQRPGGYTRILKTGTRLGDNAEMCIIELVDYNENLLKTKEEVTKSGRKRRRGGKKKAEELASGTTPVETVDEKDESQMVKEESADTSVIEETSENKLDDETKVTSEAPEAKKKQESKPIKKEGKDKETKAAKKKTKEKKGPKEKKEK